MTGIESDPVRDAQEQMFHEIVQYFLKTSLPGKAPASKDGGRHSPRSQMPGSE